MGPPSPCAGVFLPSTGNESNIPISWTVGDDHYGTVTHYKVELKLEDDETGYYRWREHAIIEVSRSSACSSYRNKAKIRRPSLQESPSIIIKELGGDHGKRASSISDLPHNRMYRARISAANAFGYGQPSAPSEPFLTASGPPASAPQNVSGGGGKRDTLVVNWRPIPPEDRGGVDFAYDLYYRVKGNEKWETIEMIRSVNDTRTPPYCTLQIGSNGTRVETVILVTGEDNFYRLYEVKIRGRNKKVTNINGVDIKTDQFGPWTDLAEVRSAERVPTVAPKDVACGSVQPVGSYCVLDASREQSPNIRRCFDWISNCLLASTCQLQVHWGGPESTDGGLSCNDKPCTAWSVRASLLDWIRTHITAFEFRHVTKSCNTLHVPGRFNILFCYRHLTRPVMDQNLMFSKWRHLNQPPKNTQPW